MELVNLNINVNMKYNISNFKLFIILNTVYIKQFHGKYE